eukprot:5077463-Prymnesium_polylepis.1
MFRGLSGLVPNKTRSAGCRSESQVRLYADSYAMTFHGAAIGAWLLLEHRDAKAAAASAAPTPTLEVVPRVAECASRQATPI